MTRKDAALTRRHVLETVGAFAVAGVCRAARGAAANAAIPTWPEAHARAVLGSFELLTADALEHIRRMGPERGGFGSTTLAELVRDTAAEAGLPTAALLTEEPASLRRRLQASIRRDFHAGRTVTLDGWVLARSELRIYTLAALL
jgi:hypothetical protein